MKILAIDTSANVATAAVLEDERLICEYVVNNKKTHSQTIMVIIDTILKQAELDISDIDVLAVANGPGSFTGLRIGISVAKGLFFGNGKKIIGISTLEALGYNLPYCKNIICPIMDARRSQVYNAVYKWEEETLKEIKKPRAISIDEVLDEFLESDEKIVFLGDGVSPNLEKIKETLGERAIFAPASCNLQKASTLGVIAKKRYEEKKAVKSHELRPVYLRKSQAEREMEEKLKSTKA